MPLSNPVVPVIIAVSTAVKHDVSLKQVILIKTVGRDPVLETYLTVVRIRDEFSFDCRRSTRWERFKLFMRTAWRNTLTKMLWDLIRDGYDIVSGTGRLTIVTDYRRSTTTEVEGSRT